MEKRRRVAVYDNSLFMAGVITSLQADPGLEVLIVHPDSPEAGHWPDENVLAAVVFDLAEHSNRPDIAVLSSHPDLLLIGLDPTRDEILVLSSRSEAVVRMADLVKMIHKLKQG